MSPCLFQTIAKIPEAIEKGGRQREMPCGRQQGRKHKEIIVTTLLIQCYVRQVILKYVCVSMCVCVLMYFNLFTCNLLLQANKVVIYYNYCLYDL